MNYKLYQAEDFVADESFIAYYYKQDEGAIAFWVEWIAHHPEKLDEIYNAEQLLAKLNLHLDEDELQDAFAKFDDFLTQDEQKARPVETANIKFFPFKKLAIAAVLLVMFSFGGYQLYQTQFNKLEYLTIHNGNGKVSEFLLSDGSKISLGSNSTLKYPRAFKGDKRDVELVGEAFFEVAKDKAKPFNVITAGLITTVLGTKFNVSAYKGHKIGVALVEGKVEVKTPEGRDRMILEPSEMATFDADNGNLNRSGFDENSITAWKDGTVLFTNASFQEIAARLNQIYGIELIDRTKNLKWSYSGQFKKTDYLTIIKNICFAKKINYKQTNLTFTLTN